MASTVAGRGSALGLESPWRNLARNGAVIVAPGCLVEGRVVVVDLRLKSVLNWILCKL